MISLSGFKVVHGDKVLNALAIMEWQMKEDFYNGEKRPEIAKPKFLEIMAINEDGNIIIIHDESWRFQFLPIVKAGGLND